MTYLGFEQVYGCGRAAQRATRFLRASVFGLTMAAVGCGSGSQSKQLTLTAPMDGQTLTSADDADAEKAGVQFDVEGKAARLNKNTSVELYIDDEKQGVVAMVDDKSAVHMPGVTLLPGSHTIYLQTVTGSASSNKMQKYTLKALEITAPEDGATLTMADDEDTKTDGFQLTVSVKSYEIDKTQKVSLLVDGKPSDSKLPDDSGVVAFNAVTLLYGKHTLQASVTEGDTTITSDEVTITLQQSCANVTYIQPAPPAAGTMGITLGGAGKCPAKTIDPFTTTVEISTDAGDGRSVDLLVNGQQVASTKVKGSTAVFSDVALTNHTGSNKISVKVADASNHVCPIDFPADVFVDCAGPDCTIRNPMPFVFKDNNSTTLFLNRSMTSSGGKGFDIEVGSGVEAVGQNIELVIDGNNTKPIKASADAKVSHAVFTAVALNEGAHKVQAICTDSAGNQTSSDEFDWSVDITACDVAVTDPTAHAELLPDDDTDSSAVGTQKIVTSTVSGGDCTGKRAAVCDPKSGIKDADAEFVAYDGASPLMSTVTLDDALSDQNLCVEIQDHAGNIGRADVAVIFHGPPRLQFESPDDGTKFNVAGGTGYTADADSLTPVCNAEFSIACTEIGTDVELHRTDATTTAFASAPCAAPASGSAALPSGFSGRAKLTAAFDDGSSRDVKVVATQTVVGSSLKTVVGQASIMLHGDCQAPQLSFMNDACATGTSGFLVLAEAAAFDVQVANSDSDSASFALAVSNDGSTAAGSPPTPTVTDALGTFDNVNLGGAGNVTLSASSIDGFGNTGMISCSSPIVVVDDRPSIVSFTSPADNATFGPGSGCSTGNGSEFGLHVVATIDKKAQRTASVSVNGTVVASSVTIGNAGEIDVCVPAAGNGANTVEVTATSTRSNATATASHAVTVRLVNFTGPSDGVTLLPAADCMPSGGGFGTTVTVQVDPSLNNAAYTLTGSSAVTGTVSAGMISKCVPLAEGDNTITVSVGGSMIMDVPVHVTVISQAPPAVVLDTPTALDPLAAGYRAGVQTITWPAPMSSSFPGGIQSYELRCDYTSLASGATTQAKDTWWAAAKVITPVGASSIAVDAVTAQVTLRPQEPNNCVLRAANKAAKLTLIDQSTDLTTLALRQVVLSTGAASSNLSVGWVVAAAGDVNDDQKADVLVGGLGHAELVFGSDLTGSTTKVVFTGAGGGVGDGGVGYAVAGIGDFNHDTIDDFAIADPYYNGYDGRVVVFFGRAGGWPTTPIDLEAGPACPGDLCIEDPAGAGDEIALAISSAGDFDGDGIDDLAIGSPFFPATGDGSGGFLVEGRALVVLGNNYENRPCSATCRATVETCQNGVCALTGQTFWGLRYDATAGTWLNAPSGTPTVLKGFAVNNDHGGANDLASTGFGGSLAALRNRDGTAGDELVIGAPESSLVQFLSGRPYTGTTGFTLLTRADLGQRNPTTPVGYTPPFKTGAGGTSFGFKVASVGNVYDVAGSLGTGTEDLVIAPLPTNDDFFIYPGDRSSSGDPGFSASPIHVLGNDSSNPATSLATSMHPVYGLLGDLDKDGKADLMTGTRTTKEAALWYNDRIASHVATNSMDKRFSAAVFHLTTEVAGTADLSVEYVGDFNGDGYLDLAVGDPFANSGGQIVLFY